METVVPTFPDATREEPNVTIIRSGRVSRPPRSLTKDMVVYESIQDITQIDPDIDWMSPLAYAASTDPDVMYLHKGPCCNQIRLFLRAMMEEVEGQTRNNNWVLVRRNKLPRNVRVLPCVWTMRRKRRILDGTVY
jgi:hypothetical protein